MHFLLLVFILTCSLNAHSADYYFSSHTFGYSETAPIKQIAFDDFEGARFYGGENSFTHNRWEAGAILKGVRIAAIARYDYYIENTEDTAELIYADKNDRVIEDGRTYDIYLRVKHARTKGFKLGYATELGSHFKLGLDVSYLQTRSYLDGTIEGEFSVLGNQYTGQVAVEQIYNQDKLLDRQVDAEQGSGYALDLYFDWLASDQLGVSFSAIDLFNKIRFDDAPYTSANASSNNVTLDPQGRLDVKPSLTGQEGFRSHSIELPRQLNLKVSYDLQAYQLTTQWYRYDDLNFPSLGFSVNASETLELQASLLPADSAFSVGLNAPSWNVSLMSNRLDITKANLFGLNFAIHQRF